ncbi:Sensor protein lytS [Fibrella aestuarina BUZ 2]|uniref:Sensor protein lytS n=1 Tax=Fibrella aestuarina BUZ 2 TaxID=1166018 RepID=I0KF41_9BACT|nr:histidine kinase [Fibrella aestuarina]CCH02744.1 Sensor protein lytS [Fibrella aestuarina BUZ 2]
MAFPLPTYEQWLLLFTGGATIMLAANLVQWVIRRERIYLLYSGYILVWVVSFGIQFIDEPAHIIAFLRTINLPLFSLLYLELAIVFLNLAPHTRLMRWYRIMQWTWFVMTVPTVYFNLFSSLWQTDWHAIWLASCRIAVILGTNLTIVYSFCTQVKQTDKLARFFVVGTIALWIGEILAVVSVLTHSGLSAKEMESLPLPINLGFLMQVGILLDLACVSLGLSYRQHQQAIRQLMAEQELMRAREQHLRQQLQADLALQKLRQQHTEAQMRALQSQVNPHFLFNALNTLSALIDENPRQATDYVDELSTVYRYLLRAADQELAPLSTELDFIQSYFHLLKTRFGNGVQPAIRVAESFMDACVPPLTLQLLVENAVKHNRVLPEEPLTICIRTSAAGQLIVENNRQPRTVRVESNGVGLSNIAEKYQLLNQPLPRIEEVDGWFRVTLPLVTAVSANDPSVEAH